MFDWPFAIDHQLFMSFMASNMHAAIIGIIPYLALSQEICGFMQRVPFRNTIGAGRQDVPNLAVAGMKCLVHGQGALFGRCECLAPQLPHGIYHFTNYSPGKEAIKDKPPHFATSSRAATVENQALRGNNAQFG